jgi:predicted component of type VI protein secretion system
MGETSGYVARVDRESQTVGVSASLLGLRPVMVAVNGETLIMVQDRQGGFGDLWKDLPVRVAYEVLGDTRVARAIEILTAVDAPSLRPALENLPTPARGPGSPPPPTASRHPVAEPPARPAQPTAAKGPLTRSETSGAGIQERRADDSADADVKDGTAAIDWLIKGSRRP